MTCWATLRHNAAEAAIVGARDERVWARDGAHGSAVRLERRRDRLRSKPRLCRSSGGAASRSGRLRRRRFGDLADASFARRDYAGIVRAASPTPLWGRTKEGGRAVLRNKGAATYATTACATPHPRPPPQEGAGALTAFISVADPDGASPLLAVFGSQSSAATLGEAPGPPRRTTAAGPLRPNRRRFPLASAKRAPGGDGAPRRA